MSNPETYTCAACGNTHKKVQTDEWNDEKADQEYRDLYGGDPDEDDVVIICDTCFRKGIN